MKLLSDFWGIVVGSILGMFIGVDPAIGAGMIIGAGLLLLLSTL